MDAMHVTNLPKEVLLLPLRVFHMQPLPVLPETLQQQFIIGIRRVLRHFNRPAM